MQLLLIPRLFPCPFFCFFLLLDPAVQTEKCFSLNTSLRLDFGDPLLPTLSWGLLLSATGPCALDSKG